jgi:predicted esterase
LLCTAGCHFPFSGNERSECLGPADARHQLVYLHGMDGPNPSPQEIANRQVLSKIASTLSVRVALPRATLPCPTQPGSICWGWDFSESGLAADAARAAPLIEESAKRCFPAHSHYGILGFSNGGYLLSGVYRSCRLSDLLPKADWLVTVGSAPQSKSMTYNSRDLRGCGSLVVMSGTRDEFNSDSDGGLLKELEERRANAREVTYDGGHLLSLEATEAVLRAEYVAGESVGPR